MNQTYKFKTLQIAQNGQEKEQPQKNQNAITVFETGETRTIDFILKDGTRQNFAYTYYITSWIGIDKDSEKNERVIKISFTTHLITIKGYCLDEIYNALTSLSLKSVKENNERYLNDNIEYESFIFNIKIEREKTNQ